MIEPSREIGEPRALSLESCSRMLQPPSRVVDALHVALNAPLHCALQPGHPVPQVVRELERGRCGKLRGPRGGWRANVGDEIADREVGLMSDAADHRNFRLEDRARDDLFVE